MARLNITRCDRCNTEVQRPPGASKVTIESDGQTVKVGRQFGKENSNGKPFDLCEGCTDALIKWLSRDNTTRAGYPPVGYRESCPHHVPCAGPCSEGSLVKTR